jgi:hypothetical protein
LLYSNENLFSVHIIDYYPEFQLKKCEISIEMKKSGTVCKLEVEMNPEEAEKMMQSVKYCINRCFNDQIVLSDTVLFVTNEAYHLTKESSPSIADNDRFTDYIRDKNLYRDVYPEPVKPMECYKHETDDSSFVQNYHHKAVKRTNEKLMAETIMPGTLYRYINKHVLEYEDGTKEFILKVETVNHKNHIWYFKEDFNKSSAIVFARQWENEHNDSYYPVSQDESDPL